MTPDPRHCAACMLLLLASCNRTPQQAEYVQPQWQLAPSTQPTPPATDSAPDAAIAATDPGGNAATQATRQQAAALQDALRNAARPPDPARMIDPEAARAAASRVPGVRSVVWVDDANLLALVDGHARRSHQTIDEICYQLAPLGDTLGVVVNLQNSAARNRDELAILSRNCQLVPGDRAVAQGQRQIDALPPEVRAEYRAGQATLETRPKRPHTQGDKAALEAIPEM